MTRLPGTFQHIYNFRNVIKLIRNSSIPSEGTASFFDVFLNIFLGCLIVCFRGLEIFFFGSFVLAGRVAESER
jgi:hypothetical protein